MRARAALAGVLFLLFLSVPACRRVDPSAAEAPPPGETWLTQEQIRGARLAIEPAGVRTLALHLTAAGRVAFDESRVAHVFSPVSGRVARAQAGLGDQVRVGESLAIIESPDLASAWSDLAKARADSVAAARELDREKNLYEHQAAAERDYETARDNNEKASAEVARARLRLRLLHAAEDGPATQEYFLRSPIAGEVIARTATPGLEVQGMLSSANVAQELFTVGQIDPVWVWGDIYERDLGRVRRGQKVAISSVAYPGRAIDGTVDFVGGSLDKDTRTVRIRCAVQNPERLLKPEMYVTLSVELDRKETLALPRTAVLKSGDRQTVLVEDGKAPDGRTRFRERAVTLGEADDGWVAVASGVAPGERVVVSGAILLTSAGE